MQTLRQFIGCERGTATVEFVMSLPVILALTVIAVEYADGLITREALDGALDDATRILSRAPLTVTDNGGNRTLGFYNEFLTQAQQLIADRTGRDFNQVVFNASAVELKSDNVEYRTTPIIIVTDARIGLDLGLLSILNTWLFAADSNLASGDGSRSSEVVTGLVMIARDRARYLGDNQPGVIACPPGSGDASGICEEIL
ncbi:MAG: TadE/TadG family type IV pilus assembly protein [Paracoccaceae bacterium]